MISAKHWTSLLSFSLVTSIVSITGFAASANAISLTSSITIPGESTDLYSLGGNSANNNRLGGFFSDLYYDRYNNVYYGLTDRGPGGGVISYNTRVQKFSLDVNSNTGAISGFKLLDTILFTQDGKNFNGLNPSKLNGNAGVLGLSFDPEGFAIAPNGNFYVSDEYGPSVYEFSPTGSFLRAFNTPENLIPKAGSDLNYVDGRPIITSGRQDNRGFEGVTLSPDGSKLYGLLQDPLVNEGSPDGRRSSNLRLVEYDTKTGESTAQYIYQLESLESINSRVSEDTFGANSQGRNIGISAITALNDKEFLVLERDNRGVGVEDATGEIPVGSKRVYKISLTGATDVKGVSLAGLNTLPTGVIPVNKSTSPFIDVAELLKANELIIPEKLEGLAIGPQLADGSYAILVGTDNDFSVTQNDDDEQFDVCTDGTQVAIDSGCPAGQALIPTYLYALKASSEDLKGFVPPAKVPEPTATAGVILLGLSTFWLKRLGKGE
ncbi:MAG: esterase-like activity of phytase family protein [Desmonostoc vinosum HA7617-LM4]|jgi:hypothetical protein|nr:esterase-like activity of phytase family protein [Desmonostoc vinosum HA7617-LM4]